MCLCEFGEVASPLTPDVVAGLQELLRDVWTSHLLQSSGVRQTTDQLMFLHEPGEPYLTVYRQDLVQCTNHRILRQLYTARGEPRTAQAFHVAPLDNLTLAGLEVVNSQTRSAGRS